MTILSKKYTLPLFLAITAGLSIVLTSCGGGGGGGIFKAISEEEKLNKSTAPLNIRGLTYCGGNLYVTNGNKIYTKSANSKRTGWSEVPGYNSSIATIASNGTDLYVMTWNTASESSGTTNPINRHGGGQISGLGIIYNIFDNKVSGSGQKCYAYTSSGTYELNGTTATKVGTFKSAYGTTTRGEDYCAGGEAFNNDATISDVTGTITGMAFYNSKVYLTTTNGLYRKESGGWKSCPFTDQPNSGQFAGMGAYGIWAVGNTLYISAYTSDSKRHGLWSYYGGDDSWNME